ncbi:hypothetical protein [Actinomycetospora sp. CA-053990]|uniref:hypothetical protein n=1 Tax=Actinomycetospora sp. CA-053990 TaxID=3239891 RepID=UPI003D8A574A
MATDRFHEQAWRAWVQTKQRRHPITGAPLPPNDDDWGWMKAKASTLRRVATGPNTGEWLLNHSKPV